MNNQKMKVGIAATLTLTVGISIFATNYKLNRNNPYDNQEISYTTEFSLKEESTRLSNVYFTNISDNIETTTEAENKSENIMTTIMEETSKKNDNVSEIDYDKLSLKNELNEVLSEKEFDSLVNEYLNEVFNKLYDNYDNMYRVHTNSEFPDKTTFIRDRFINNIKNNINSIVLVDENSSKEDIDSLGGSNGMFVSYGKKIFIDKRLNEEDILNTMFHEITHATQGEIGTIYKKYNGLYNVFTEGKSSYISTFMDDKISACNGADCYFRGDERYLFYSSDSAYSLYARYYAMILYLSDYDTIESLEKDFDINNLIDSIEGKYNINARSFLFNVNKLCSTDKIDFNMVKDLENVYFNCLKQDLDKVSSSEEAYKLLEDYRYFKLQYRVECDVWDEDYNSKDITDEKFPMYLEFEEQLYEKVSQYDILPNENRREIFDTILLRNNKGNKNLEISVSNLNVLYNDTGFIITSKDNDMAQEYNLATNTVENIENNESYYENSVSLVNTKSKII